jgi:ParB family transcriptional regulator, chromosome partitioning protein
MSDKRRGLGRGLGALLPSTTGEGVRKLPLAELAPNRFQPRAQFDERGLEQLTESIRARGVLQPIVVTPSVAGIYTIIAGERRWRAAGRAGLATVPVVVREVENDRELLELALIENVQRSDLNPIEEAEAYQTLVTTFNLSHEEVAHRVGKSRSAITNALRLLRLPPRVHDLLRAGRLSPGQVRPLLALDDPAEIERLAELAAQEGIAARSMEALGAAKKGGRRRSRPEIDPNTAAAAERLTRKLQTRVEIERRGEGGIVRIHFHSEEELMRLFDDLQ